MTDFVNAEPFIIIQLASWYISYDFNYVHIVENRPSIGARPTGGPGAGWAAPLGPAKRGPAGGACPMYMHMCASSLDFMAHARQANAPLASIIYGWPLSLHGSPTVIVQAGYK